jgi:molybdopterin molybdotransferase
MKKFGRTEFQRGICSADNAGRLHVSSTGDQGSAMLSSMSKANCLILLEPEQQNILAGDRVKVLLFDGLV